MSNSYHDIGALSIKLNLQTNDFNRKISAINKEIRALESDFKSAGKGVKNFENTFQGVNTKIKTLSNQLSLSNTKLKEQTKRHQELSHSLNHEKETLGILAEHLGKSSVEYKTQSRLVSQLAEKVRKAGTDINKTKGDIRAYSSSLEECREKMKAMENSTKTFAEKLEDLQSEAKLTGSAFDVMMASLEDGSFAKANIEIQRLTSEIEGAKKQVALYSTELSKLESAYAETQKEQNQLTTEIKQVSTALQKAKSEYGESHIEVERLNDRLMVLKTRLASVREGHNSNATAIQNHRTQINNLNASIMTMNSQMNSIPFDTVSNKFNSIGQSMVSTGAMMSATIGLPMTMLGKSAVTTAVDFEESMSKVQAISNASGSELEALTEQARELGRTTSFSATESSQAMQFLSMAGLDVNEVMTAMPSQLNLAKAGMLDLGTTADITTNIMSGFGQSAGDLEHIGDVLAYASSNANTNIQQMGEAMVYLAPVGQTLGLSLEDVSSAVMAVSDSGIQGARAGAAFSTSLVRLTKPTEKMEELMEELGISFTETNGTMKPISKIVGELNTAMSDYTDSQKASAINTLFGAEATKHWASLLTVGEDKLKSNTKALEECDGTAERMAKTMGDNLAGSIKEMKSKIEDFLITVGNALAPTIEWCAEKIGQLADWFNELSPATQGAIVKIGLLAVAVPLLTTAIGFLVTGIGKLASIGKVFSGLGKVAGVMTGLSTTAGTTATAIGGVASGTGLLARALPLLTNPLTGLAVALAGATAGFVYYNSQAKKNFDEVVSNARESASGVEKYLVKELPSKLSEASEQINNTEFFSQSTKNELVRNVTALEEELASGGDRVHEKVQKLTETLSTNMEEIPEGMRQSVADGIVEMAQALHIDGQLFRSEFKAIVDELNADANIEVKVDWDAVESARKMTYSLNQFIEDFETEIGNKINSRGDFTKSFELLTQNLQDNADADLEYLRNHIGNIIEVQAGLVDSTIDKNSYLKEMIYNIADEVDPTHLGMVLTEFTQQWDYSYKDIIGLTNDFYGLYEQSGVLGKERIASVYSSFLTETDNFNLLLQGKFGSLSEGNAQFWSQVVQATGQKGGELHATVSEWINAYLGEVDKADTSEGYARAVEQMASFIGNLQSNGVIGEQTVAEMVSVINGKLGEIDEEVLTNITANASDFNTETIKVLDELGAIDRYTAVSQIEANNEEAKKKMIETEKRAEDMQKSVEAGIPYIMADNSIALQKILDVENSTISDKTFNIKAKLINNTGVSLNGKPQNGPIKKSVDSPSTFSSDSTFSDFASSMNESYEQVRNSLSTLDYSSSAYQRSGALVEDSVITVKNSNDSTMISLLQTMVQQMNSMNQRQNTLEAQLYIDGRQLKSHIELLDKRSNRLNGK